MKLPVTIINSLYLFTGLVSCLLPTKLYAQPAAKQSHNFSTISFQHLTTANGLSYGRVYDICTDKLGNTWIATGNGLNMFNGKTVTKYYVADYPQLISNNISQVICDKNNRIWVLTDKQHVIMIDEQRHLHKVTLYHNNKTIKTTALLCTKSSGAVLLTEKGHYAYNNIVVPGTNDSLGQQYFYPVSIANFDTLQTKKYKHRFKFDDDRYFFSQDTVLFVVNYQTKQVEKNAVFLMVTC